jgi:hypothetical protein
VVGVYVVAGEALVALVAAMVVVVVVAAVRGGVCGGGACGGAPCGAWVQAVALASRSSGCEAGLGFGRRAEHGLR